MTALTQNQIIDLLRQHVNAGCTDVLSAEPRQHYQQNALDRQAKTAQAAPHHLEAVQEIAPVQDMVQDKAQDMVQDMAQAPLAPATTPPATAIARPATGRHDTQDAIAMAQKVAAEAETWQALHQAIQDFDHCALKATAKNCVFQDGVVGAKIMLIGEAPGKEEDLEGRPFVGPAGQMLDKMLASIGLSRDENIYITNVVPWRPPGNRPPSADEIAICQPFLTRHIELAQPEILLLAGNISSKTLLQTQTGITKLRGQWQTYQPDGLNLQALPMLHPAYVVRRPETKADVWADLCELKTKLGNA